jgi:hypothetical protein
MESRIDESPPVMPAETAQPDSLKALVAANPVEASLNLQETDLGTNDIFVRFHTAVVLLGSSEWDESSVLAGVANFLRPMLTAGSLGVDWRSNSGRQELDGLWNLSAAVRGKYLFLSDDSRLLDELVRNLRQSVTASPATFVAGFQHAGERARFDSLTTLLDKQGARWTKNRGRAPSFLSDNISSLSSVLAGVSSEKVVVQDSSEKVLETVTYKWSP